MINYSYEKRDRIILQILIKGKVHRQDLKQEFYNIRSIPAFVNKNNKYFKIDGEYVEINREDPPKWIQYILYIQDQYKKGEGYVRESELSKVFGSKSSEGLSKKKSFVIKRKIGGRTAWELVEILKQASLPNQITYQIQDESKCPQEIV
jgi:hypothetical protein